MRKSPDRTSGLFDSLLCWRNQTARSLPTKGVNMFRIHDLMTGFEGLHVPGLKYYADRALILPGTVVVNDGDIDDHLHYLRDIGIGPSKVIRLDCDQLVQGFHKETEAREALLDAVRDGEKVQFFSTTRHEQALLDSLGLNWSHAFSAPLEITNASNDKAALRRLGAVLDLSDVFPEHRMCNPQSFQEIIGIVDALFQKSECDFAILKRPDLASGDGMKRVSRSCDYYQCVDAYLREHSGAKEIIVEAGFEHVPMSIQWEIDDAGVSYACGTAQLINPTTLSHEGNILSSHDLPDVTFEDLSEMQRMSKPFAEFYAQNGFRGICGFDFLRANRNGRVYLLECNGRVTATTYCNGLARQIADRCSSWALVMTLVSTPTSVRTFQDVRHILGSLLFDGVSGALPFNTRCLQLEHPKFTVCCVMSNAIEAQNLLVEVRNRFSHE